MPIEHLPARLQESFMRDSLYLLDKLQHPVFDALHGAAPNEAITTGAEVKSLAVANFHGAGGPQRQ
jgi:hypothetical protein